MLAIKGLPTGMLPTIGTLAERMQIQHHSAVELVNRLSSRGLVRRSRAGEDRRQVLLGLTPKGEKSCESYRWDTRPSCAVKARPWSPP